MDNYKPETKTADRGPNASAISLDVTCVIIHYFKINSERWIKKMCKM